MRRMSGTSTCLAFLKLRRAAFACTARRVFDPLAEGKDLNWLLADGE